MSTPLEQELERSQSTLDLWRDEFQRIRALCSTTGGSLSEIKQLCDRALDWGVKQRFTLIDQRDAAEQRAERAETEAATATQSRHVVVSVLGGVCYEEVVPKGVRVHIVDLDNLKDELGRAAAERRLQEVKREARRKNRGNRQSP